MPQQPSQQQQRQHQQQPVAVYSSLSDSHTSRDIQHSPQQDQLWKIIEKQRVLIQGLQKSNAILAAERDGLRDRIVHLEQRLASSNKGETGEDVSVPGSMTCYSPTPPPRSPYRASNSNSKHNDDNSSSSSGHQHPYHHNADNTSRGVSPPPPPPPPFDRRPSTPASPPPAPSTPTSPQTIIEKDAQLYAQYQMSIQRKESHHYNSNNNNRPTPSKSTDTATSSSYYHRPELGKWSSSAVDVSSNGVHKIHHSRSNINDSTTTSWSPSPSNSNDDDHSSPAAAAAAAAGGEAPLRLAKLMDDVIVKVVGSNIKRNEKGREVVSFVISVGKRGGGGGGASDTYEELWRVEKLYSDILALDTKIKSTGDHTIKKKMSKLPDKQLLSSNSRAPNKIDQRKVALEQYLQHLVSLPHSDITDICEFLSTNVCERDVSFQKTGRKAGYLTKRGKNFGGWKSRYFVINGPVLEYYESKDGAYLGEIKLTNAQLGRQTKPHPAVEDIVYRHAFLIVEQKRPGVHSSLSRHILCANSDEERDEWVQALMLNIRQGGDNSSSSTSSSSTSRADNVGGAGNSSNNGTNTKKATKKGDKTRKISKVEIRPVAAAPISHMKPNLGADMDKLTSVPSVNVVPLSSPTLDNNNVIDECKSPTSDSAPEPSPSSSSSATLSTSLPNMHVSPMLGGHYQPQLASPPPPPPPPPPPSSSHQGSTTPPSSTTSSPTPPPPPPPHQTPPSREMPPRRNSTSNVSESMDDDSTRLRQTMGSPIPNAIRSSEDLVLDSGNNDVSERRIKQKANRVTMWGKKMFSSSSSSGGGSSNAEGGGTGSPNPSARPSTSSSLAPTDNNDTASRMSSVPSGFRSFLSRSSNDSNERHSEDSNGSKQVFGVPLEDAVRVSRVVEGYELPSVVYRCIEYLDAKKAVMEEGLYRLSGSNMVIQKLKKKFNQDGDVNLLAAKEEYDVHAIAGLLKLWLRELPTTVLTREHRADFLHVIDLLDRKDRVNELGRLVSLIPLANYTLLRALTAHLLQVVQHSETNKMTMRNVSIVFAPTLGIPPSIFNLFMSEFEYIFWTTENGDAAPRMIEKDEKDNEEQVANEEKGDDQAAQQQHEEESPAPPNTTDTDTQQQDKPTTPSSSPSPPLPSLQRNHTLRLREESGRSNRNSVNYMDGAPNAIVSMEKNVDGVSALAMDEEEDDVDDLAVLKTSDEEESSDRDEDEVVEALINKRYSRLPPPQGLSPMPPHRAPTTTSSKGSSGLQPLQQ